MYTDEAFQVLNSKEKLASLICRIRLRPEYQDMYDERSMSFCLIVLYERLNDQIEQSSHLLYSFPCASVKF